jgi:hypothetical protein
MNYWIRINFGVNYEMVILMKTILVILILFQLCSCARTPIVPAASEQELYEMIVDDMIASGCIAVNYEVDNEPDVDASIKHMKEFIKRYPDSQYSEEIHAYLAFTYGYDKKDYVRAIEECDYIINNYPDSGIFLDQVEYMREMFKRTFEASIYRKPVEREVQ